MKQNLSMLFGSTIIVIILFSNNLWSSNIQIDSTIKTINVPNQITNLDSIINRSYLFYPLISRLSLYNYSDTLISLADINNFSQQLKNDYLFHSNFSEQWQINDQLANYLQYRKELSLKSDLGVLGKVLGNSRTIATIILAIFHVLKYRKGLY